MPTGNPRRALQLLADCPAGCTQSLLLAHGITVETLCALVGAGLATAAALRVVAGGKLIEITQINITDAGRMALER